MTDSILSLYVRPFTCLNFFKTHNYPYSTYGETEARDD